MHALRKISLLTHPTILLGYFVAVMMTIVGLLVLFGFLVHQGVPERFRIMFGVVLALMGVYRFVLTRTRQMRMMRDEDEDEWGRRG